MNHQLIIKNIAKGSYSPIYFLHGQEPYFIDLIEKFATSKIISEAAKDLKLLRTTLIEKVKKYGL